MATDIETWQRYNKVTCPKCNSKSIKKAGTRISIERGNLQRYWCKSCNFHFSPHNQDYRMRYNKYKIQRAIELYKEKKYSLREIAKKIKGVSHTSVFRWLKKFDRPRFEL